MKAKSKSSYSEFRRMTSCNIIQAPVEVPRKESQFNQVKRLSMELENLSRRRTSSFTSETLIGSPPLLDFTTPFNIDSPPISADRVIQRKISSYGQKPSQSFDIIEEDIDLLEDEPSYAAKQLLFSAEISKAKQRNIEMPNQFSAKQETNPNKKETVRAAKAITERPGPEKVEKLVNSIAIQKKIPLRKEGATMLKSTVDKRALDFKKPQIRKIVLKDEMKPTRMLNEKEKAILMARIRGLEKLVITSEIEASNLENILTACSNLQEQLGH